MVLPTSSDAPITCAHWDEVMDEDGFLALGRNRYHCSYIVYTDGTYYYAEDGTTGILNYGGPNNRGAITGTDFQAVMQAACDDLASGGLIKLRAGSYSLTGTVTPGNNSTGIIGEGESTIITRTDNSYMFTIDCDNAEIAHMRLNGAGFENAGIYGLTPGVHLRPMIHHLYMESFDVTAGAVIYPRYCTAGIIANNYITSGWRAIRIVDATRFTIRNNYITLAGSAGVSIADNAEGCDVVENVIYNCGVGISMSAVGLGNNRIIDNLVDTTTTGNGIGCAQDNTQVIGNRVIDSTDVGIGTSGLYNLVKGNIVEGGGVSGITIEQDAGQPYPEYVTVEGNIVRECGYRGIYVFNANDVSILDNIILNCGQDAVDTYDGILIGPDVDRFLVKGNIIRDDNVVPNIRNCIRVSDGDDGAIIGNTLTGATHWGIHLAADLVVRCLVQDNVFEGNGDGPVDDDGTDTRFPSVILPFVEGSTFLSDETAGPLGWEIDANTEYAIALGVIPPNVYAPVRWKIWATSVILEADAMRLEIKGYGGQSNDPYNTEYVLAVDKPSTTTNFAANDVIYWMLDKNDDIDIDDMTAGHQVFVKVLHEAAGGADCATDAVFTCVEIEYV